MRNKSHQLVAQFLFLGLLLSLVDSKGTFYGGSVNPFYGNRYNLFKAGLNPHHSPNKPMTRHKNHCAYVVQKNITCIMQDGVSTFVKAEYTTKCIWGQKCPVVMYRTFFKPKYKVGYKTVTELEWRCCPSYSGADCFDGPTSLPDVMMPPFKGAGVPHRPGMKGFPHGPRPPVDQRPGSGQLEPGKPLPGVPDHRPIPSGQLPTGNGQPNYGVTGERLDRMEEDLRRLTQGLDTLNGVVAGLEERLRISLREDTNKILVSLLQNPPRVPDSTVGFEVIPDGPRGGETFNGFGDLAGRVTEVRDELRAKTHIIEEIQGMVLSHDGQLKKLLEGARGRPIPGPSSTAYLDEILDIKLAGVRAEILDGFERRLTGLENHCDTKIGEVQRQCHRDHMDGQEQMQQSLDGKETGLREELGSLQAQIQGLTLTESCCGQVNSLSQRVLLLEDSVKGLTESQRQLQSALTDQSIHVETLVETRLIEIESRLNATEGGPDGVAGLPGGLDGFKTMLEDKLKTLEERVFVAVEEVKLSNATSPAVLEGQVVPALETEIESVRRRVEGELDGIQKQLIDLELLCTSSCAPSTPPAGGISITEVEEECEGMEKKMTDRLDTHSNQLNHLNNTLQNLLFRIAQEDTEGIVQGEITLLKVNINSVNRTLKGLKDSINFIASEVGHANSTWEQREHQLVNQVQGITKLVGHQAHLLGAGDRRLAQLKGELVALKRQLSGELQGCRSTAIEVQKEVKDVDSRVSQVEGQCSNLGELAEHLERIRAELERHSDSYLAQVNGTLANHSEQIAELKGEVKDCATRETANQKGDQ
ncbi:EMILIN-3 EMILIN-5 Elastin microfibril interface-located protein 3 [Larimichthys crocea]|uniref:EMILIN-3 EMILIN-5 Elastin microfibril interface-located protein 3 n=1 Tax=Larimichthys crocea TaxID=215358 RepID=A0A6G0IPW4_LARCR|nr:EMILIN-3 EMILIN-5 Elastin microfibril interface-located protein 3 [Larimichthys crocea]